MPAPERLESTMTRTRNEDLDVAIGQLTTLLPRAVATLERLLKSTDGRVQIAAARALIDCYICLNAHIKGKDVPVMLNDEGLMYWPSDDPA